MPPPPGHREIQQEELSRLFGRMAGARLVALPPILALALWLAFVEPAWWRRIGLAAVVAALGVFFVAEWVAWRRRGFTPGAVPRNLAVGVAASSIIAFATGGLASPFLYVTVVLALIIGVFVPFPTGAALVAAQVAAAWLFAWLGASGAVPDFAIAVFGGGGRDPAPAAFAAVPGPEIPVPPPPGDEPVLDLAEGSRILGRRLRQDDLIALEGIGPKIARLCNEQGITTWRQLSMTPVPRLEAILAAAGSAYAVHDPASWPHQAALLADGRWTEFRELINRLRGGRY